jgi:LysM repeat protein
LVRELNKLTEGKALNRSEIHDLFKGAEEAMTAGNKNRNILGKAGDLAGALGAKIKGLGKALQDTTVVQGVDAKFDELKKAASMGMGKSPEGSRVLRALDTYKQTAQRYPTTSKFFWGVAGVLTGLLTSGAAPVLALGAIKMIDGLMQGEQFSTAAGRATRPVGAALGVKAATAAGDVIANTDIPDINNPFKPNPPGPDNVVPPGPDNVVPPGGETQTITVKQGDTLSDISAKYKVDPDVMAKLNPGKFGPSGNPNILSPGDQIVLPKNIDAAAYKGPYSGDNAMTAQNIQNKMDAGQLGSDQGMAAKRIAADAAAAKAKTAASSAPSAQTPTPSAQDPFANRMVRTESVKIKKGRNILEGFDIITAPVGMLVDRQATVRKWALNESLGRDNKRSVQLNEAGIRTVFANLERLHEFAMDEARRYNIGRERSHAMGQAAGRAGAAQAATQNAAAKAAAEKAGRAAPAPVKGKMTAQQFAQSNPAAAADIAASTPEPGIPDPGTVDSFAAGRGERTSADLQKDQQGGTVRSRPANANDPAAMAKNARTSATNVSNTAGPLAGLTGGNVGGLATGTAPAGNTMPYLAADPEGKFKTKGKGPLGGKLMRGIESGLKRFGNWAGDSWREATTKVTLNGLLRHWQDADSPTDSDEVAKFLVGRKVPPEIIKQLFTQLNFPAPKLDAPATAAGAAGAAAGGAAGGADAIDPYNRDDRGNVRFFANGAPDMSAGVSSTDTGAGGAGAGGSTTTTTTSGGMQGSTPGGTTTGGSQGDGQIASATNMILPQLARMTSMAYADDLITIIDTAMSVLSRAAPPVYREKLKQFRGTSAGQTTEKPAEIIKRTKGKRSKGKGGAQDTVPKKQLGPSELVSNNPGASTQADQRVAQANEQTRAYGGKYIRESADTKLAREFENFVLDAVKL